MVKDIVGYKGEILWDALKPDGTPGKLLDVEKISNLGWKANIGLHKGIEEVYRIYLATADKKISDVSPSLLSRGEGLLSKISECCESYEISIRNG